MTALLPEAQKPLEGAVLPWGMIKRSKACKFSPMCGRFNIIDDPLTQLLMDITGLPGDWNIRTEFNIAPTQIIPVLTFEEATWQVKEMRWWLTPYWSKEPTTKYSTFNAKSETLATSSAFREPFKTRRCIVPASGYYEWRKEGSEKLPYYIEPDDDPGFAFAGLWDRWQSEDQVIESCTVITAAAPEAMKHIHSRIPVHLTAEQARCWVSNATPLNVLNDMLQPEIRTTIRVTPVSTVVNNARNKDDRCIEPLGPSKVI